MYPGFNRFFWCVLSWVFFPSFLFLLEPDWSWVRSPCSVLWSVKLSSVCTHETHVNIGGRWYFIVSTRQKQLLVCSRDYDIISKEKHNKILMISGQLKHVSFMYVSRIYLFGAGGVRKFCYKIYSHSRSTIIQLWPLSRAHSLVPVLSCPEPPFYLVKHFVSTISLYLYFFNSFSANYSLISNC